MFVFHNPKSGLPNPLRPPSPSRSLEAAARPILVVTTSHSRFHQSDGLSSPENTLFWSISQWIAVWQLTYSALYSVEVGTNCEICVVTFLKLIALINSAGKTLLLPVNHACLYSLVYNIALASLMICNLVVLLSLVPTFQWFSTTVWHIPRF